MLLEEIKAITDKPVTTVINTHFHFDHAHGNQIFAPGVQIIGHEFTRRALLDDPVSKPLYQSFYNFKTLEAQIENSEKRVASEQNPAAREKLQTQLTSLNSYECSSFSWRGTNARRPSSTLRSICRAMGAFCAASPCHSESC